MRRLRFFRILLPAILAVFVVLLAMAYRQRIPPTATDLPAPRPDSSRRVEDLRLKELVGDEQTLDVVAGLVEEDASGELRLESITRLALPRDDGSPLIVTAERGEIRGGAGHRTMHFADGVVITDPDEGLVLTLPVLDVDEAAGEARSSGEIRLAGGRLNGRAASLVYGLAGQPTRLLDLELANDAGARLSARTALLHDGLDDVELVGEVHSERGSGEHFDAGRMRVLRGPDEQLRRVEAEDNVDGRLVASGGTALRLRAERARIDWDAAGAPERVSLGGSAEVGHGSHSLAAERIDAIRGEDAQDPWSLRAEGSVYLQGLVPEGPAWLSARRLEGELGPDMQLRSARVFDEVRFDGPATRADADRAEFSLGADGAEIRLFSTDRGKARLARDRTRIAAEEISTDERGERLLAERRVEASLLPAANGAGRAVPAMFDAEEAIHFVAERLEGSDFAGRLIFSGNVRAWQEDQNLSAERVVLDERARSLIAEERVSTRIPRSPDLAGAAEADFVQISADRLDYDDDARLAVFQGTVRVRLAEGWMESDRLEVELPEQGSGIREIRAAVGVQVEFRDPEAEGSPQIMAGHADRLTYRPAEDSVWLHGDAAPASVRRIGENGGTTSGRLLRYRLTTGALEVDAGEQGAATIRTKAR